MFNDRRDAGVQLAERLKQASSVEREPLRLAVRIGARGYLLDMAATYLAEGRIGRAMVAANKGLEVHRGDRIHAFHCQMVLYKCSIERGDPRRALGHALAARVQAVEGRFYELEFLSSQDMADVIKQQGPEMVRQLDEEYLAMGVDLGQYLSPWVLRRETQ